MSTADEPLVLTVDYQLTEEDFMAYFRYRQWGVPGGRRRILLGWVALMLFVAAVVLVTTTPQARIYAVLVLAPALLIISAVYFLAVWHYPRDAARQYRKTPHVFQPTSLSVTPGGVAGRQGGVEFRRDWSAVREVLTTGSHLFFMLGGQHALVIPRRAFGSPAAAQKFLALAREYQDGARGSFAPSPPEEEIAEALGPDRLPVVYELADADYARFQWFQVRRQPRTVLPVVFLAVLAGCVVTVVTSSFTGVPVALATGATVAVVSFVPLLALILWLARRQLRDLPGMLGQHTLILSPLGLWGVSPGVGEGQVEWSEIEQVVANEHQVLFYRGPHFAFIIPRRAFAMPQDAEAFLLRASQWHAEAVSRLAAKAPASEPG